MRTSNEINRPTVNDARKRHSRVHQGGVYFREFHVPIFLLSHIDFRSGKRVFHGNNRQANNVIALEYK